MTTRIFSIYRRSATAALAAAALAACGAGVVEAPTDNVILPGALNNAASLPVVFAGASQDYTLAFDGDQGTNEGIILVSGLVADEYDNGDTFPTRREMDQRNMRENNTSLELVERNLHRARAAADRVAQAYLTLLPTSTNNIADLLTWSGYVSNAFAENYCSGVPESGLNADGTIAFGAPQTTNQLLDVAIRKADSALAIVGTGSGARSANRARVLKGRALLNKGEFAAAAAAVATVPTDFRDSTFHSEAQGGLFNGVFFFNSTGSRRWTVANGRGATAGGSVIAWANAGDPRVVVTTSGNTFDRVGPLRILGKYPNASAGVIIADGIEARLIEAEAALRAGDAVTFLARLNQLRATRPGLAPLVDPVTTAGRVDLLFAERGFWMFATGHRLGDFRRLIRQYGRAAEAVFPTGTYFKGGVYGSDVNIIVTQDERNNPTFTGCLDRNA